VKGCVIQGGAHKFARPKKEEEGNTDHVGNGQIGNVAKRFVYHLQDVYNDDDGNGLHAAGTVIRLLIGLDLALDTKVDAAVVGLPWVRGPQLSVRLAHRTEGVYHRVRLDGVVQGGELPITIPLAKDLEKWDGIIPSLQVWVHVCFQRPQ
jgi:hypothetical protein